MENKDIEQPEAMDLILKYLTEHKPDYRSFNQIHRDVFPEQPKEILAHLITQILKSPDRIIDGAIVESYGNDGFNGNFRASAITEHFLRTGGFSKVYEGIRKAKQEEDIQKELSTRALRDQMITNRVTRIISIASLVIALGALIVSVIALMK